jgi:hypothetical protein
MTIWTLDQACKFCIKLHDHLMPFGYDVGLTGGILFNGKSDKDIDVIIYPLKRMSANYAAMYQALPNFGLKFIRLPNKNLGYTDDGKHVEVWEFENKRVDLFFLA